MQVRLINPTAWLQSFGLNHGVEVRGGTRALFLSGQTSSDADGAPVHPGDVTAQFRLAWANLKEALAAADMAPSNVVRLNIYTTDVDGFMAQAGEAMPELGKDGCNPCCTLLGVARLYDPAILVELEATAVA